MNYIKKGFTLAEVLIVITIIGVVAAVVLPTIMDVGNDKILNKQSEVFGSKLFTALKLMNTKGDLARLESTEEFVSNLGKYIRIVKTCPSGSAYECFTKKISTGSEDEKPQLVSELDLSSAEKLGHGDWENSNIMGIQFADGTNGLIAYNTLSCSPTSVTAKDRSSGDEPSIWQSSVFDCMALVLDVNGNGSPNEMGKDIKMVNAALSGGLGGCDAYAGDTCVAFVSTSTGIDCSIEENSTACTRVNGYRQGNTGSAVKNAKFAALNEICREKNMDLATMDQLRTIKNLLGDSYLIEIAAQNSTDTFVSRQCNVGNVYQLCNGFKINHSLMRINENTTDSSVSVISGICVKN